MNFGRRQVKGIVGMVFAVLGAVAWFFQLYIPAAILWGAIRWLANVVRLF
jgi:hypothetical protein